MWSLSVILKDETFTFDDLLIIPRYNEITSRKFVRLETSIGGNKFNLPISSSPMDTVTGVKMAQFLAAVGGMPVLPRFMSIEDNVKMWEDVCINAENASMIFDGSEVAVSIGALDIDRAEALYEAGARIFFVDIAHGDSSQGHDTSRMLKECYGHAITIVSGSIATKDGVKRAQDNGCDVIRCGIGGGSACTTREKTGVGVPQAYAISECRRGIDEFDKTGKISLIADGGVRKPADAAKALALGADMVMLGGMLAGTDQAPGSIMTIGDKRYKKFRGMASQEVNEEYFGSMSDWKTAEGIETFVPYKGSASNIIRDLAGGIRSSMTYVGAPTLKDFVEKSHFFRVSGSTVHENKPHIKV
jgi:IMP dehydrogenase